MLSAFLVVPIVDLVLDAIIEGSSLDTIAFRFTSDPTAKFALGVSLGLLVGWLRIAIASDRRFIVFALLGTPFLRAILAPLLTALFTYGFVSLVVTNPVLFALETLLLSLAWAAGALFIFTRRAFQ